MYLFFSRFSKLSARRGNSRFLSLLTLPRYSMAETLRESPGVSSLDQFESNQASALTDLTGTARRGDSRFFSSSTLPRYSIAETLRWSPRASSLDEFGSTKASALTDLTGTARRGNSRFFSSGPDSSDSLLHQHRTLALTDLNCTARREGSLLPQSPYLWGGFNKIISRESTGSRIVRHSFYDPTKKKEVVSGEEMYPAVLSCNVVGASHGWFMRSDGENVYLTDLLKPWVSSPRVISLPSLKLKASFDANAVSISSSEPVQGHNFCVAATFNQYYLSVCRLYDSKWTHIKLPRSFLPVSRLTYSKRDKAFFFTSSERGHLGLLDLRNNKLKCRYLHLLNIPRISDAGPRVLGKCILTQHLVESPSGELIFIRCYTECIVKERYTDEGEIYPTRRPTNPKRFMVFREDVTSKNFCYTEDIGDLCIFLGKSENFCVSLSMYPGLRPNSIYYANGSGVGSYSLDSGKIHPFNMKGLHLGTHWISPS